ncbi:MAG: ATP-dependent DNA helicase RecG [Erysipelotrichaceae bacterium]|nr:ATP-dependent DNA helicase RecG [Erysipelotrichaceae bacterium]
MKKELYTNKEKEILKVLEMNNADDIVSHYPFRYDEIIRLPYLEWTPDCKVAFEANVITDVRTIKRGKLSISRFDVQNDDDIFHVTIFNRPWLNNLRLNTSVTIFGKYDGNQKVTAFKYNLKPLSEQLGIIPVYNLKSGVTSSAFNTIVRKTLQNYSFTNLIPSFYIQKYRLIDKHQALNAIHFPQNKKMIHDAVRHLKYEEFLKFSMIIAQRSMANQITDQRYIKNFNFDDVFRLANHLSFTLTNDQLKAVNEILADMSASKPMYRLVQGDVGCGKTIVAALGIYAAYLSGYQSAFMAPTEVLVKQQGEDLKQLFKVTDMRIAVLYSSLSAVDKNKVLADLQSGDLDLVIGTHALIQKNVHFKKLGMIVTDEQHRFGVMQRKQLIDKGTFVDILIMSATPIPRTLTNVLYGDMDVSNIMTLPKGRKPVITKLIRQNSMISILDEIELKLQQNDRCYVVCPAIEEDNDSGVRNTTAVYQALKKELSLKYKIGLLHGKMDSSKKDSVMDDFRQGLINILVTTTVVEVGVNIKEASIMVIYDANRFGLSQLHQLRGRIKRSNKQGYCYLLTESEDETAIARLQILVDYDDGFKIAEEDLRLRGPGDIFGTRQSGLPSLILGNLITDANIIKVARTDAIDIIAHPNDDNRSLRSYTTDFLQKNDYID